MMKKIISAVSALAISSAMLASCGVSGVSIPYYNLAMDNYSENVFEKYNAVKETITYYKEGAETFKYSIYMENASAHEFGYNIYESFDDYAFCGHEGELYAFSDDKTYAIIQADKSTYYEYIKDYEERAHVLDQGEKYQKYSKGLDDDMTEVSYYAKVTPMIAAELYKYGITETDKIISTYILDDDNFYLSVEYSVQRSDGTEEKLAKREFEYFKSIARDIFENVPSLDETVKVTLISNFGTESELKDVYSVPKGVNIGIDPGEKDVSYYLDADLTIEFDPENAVAERDITIYQKNN